MSRISIVGLIGSPRKGMNTDTLVSRALDGAEEEGVESVDGIVVSSPAYYGSISSQLKLVIALSTCLTEYFMSPDSI